ncbi:hypothetical protein [Dactylosporangium sp. CA-139066]|uniref:hypothetical protein n=1 Tax=Dactylosporangium sp. CA-139066 TaxID=3239930 RepID=UPI003D90FD2E
MPDEAHAPPPRGARYIVAALIAVLSYGGVVHVFQITTGGWPPYAWAPPWLAALVTGPYVRRAGRMRGRLF